MNLNNISQIYVFFILSNNPFVALIGIKIIPLYLLFYAIIYSKFIKLKNKYNNITLTYIATAAISSIYNNTYTPFVFSLLTIVYFLSILNLPVSIINKIVRILSSILFITVILGFISLLISIFIKINILDIGNLKLMPISLMYENEPYMRVAGFFYEPGQLSFYLCACVVCREILGFKRSISIAILVLGFVTQSLSHAVFMSFYFIYILNLYKIKNILIYVLLGIMLFLLTYDFYIWAIERAIGFIEEPSSWGRFISFSNTINILGKDFEKMIFGPSKSLASRVFEDNDILLEEMPNTTIYGENPLTPIIFGGLLAAWPYYLYLVYAAKEVFQGNKFGILIFAIAILTLQRPYTLEFPYSLILALVLVCNIQRNDYIKFNK